MSAFDKLGRLRMSGAWPEDNTSTEPEEPKVASKTTENIPKEERAVLASRAKERTMPGAYPIEGDDNDDPFRKENIQLLVERYMENVESPDTIFRLEKDWPLKKQQILRYALKTRPESDAAFWKPTDRNKFRKKLQDEMKPWNFVKEGQRYTNLREYMVKAFLKKNETCSEIADSFHVAISGKGHSKEPDLKQYVQEHGLKFGTTTLDSWDVLRELYYIAEKLKAKTANKQSESVRQSIKDLGYSEQDLFKKLEELEQLYIHVPL